MSVFFFYILGAVAKINSSLSRRRINFVPLNVLLVGLVGIGGFARLQSSMEAIRNGNTPVRVSLAQIRDNPRIVQKYVTVAGVEIPDAAYQYGTKGSAGRPRSVDKSWYPLLDRENHRLLLVQQSGRTSGRDPHDVTVSGMLRQMDSKVRRSLAAHHDEIGGFSVETRYVLVAGAQPGDSARSVVLTALLFGIVGLFGVSAIMRNTVFQATGRMSHPSAVAHTDLVKVGATGTFSLAQPDRALRRRFVNMPAVLTRLENGFPALLSNIVASRRFMGITTEKRAGIWSIPVEAGSVQDPQFGFLYWGTSRRKAFRFSYIDAVTRNQRWAVVTADDDVSLDSAVALLTLPASAAGWKK